MVVPGNTAESNRIQEANTIILEFNSAKKDDLRDLRAGEGKLFRKIQDTIDQLQETGELGDCVQPVIVIVQQKKSDKGILD
ncbi:hypothetical protein [Anabaena sp. UHCC 0451]|jgi:predicted solute-binding protein|uniref:DUF6200 domain-containing protein n=1 Tax=Anabaena sp. UHCC 0451 TaxID=2055235 RepID=UPI002B2007C9|nr:hypothetical protein [Anabaena sp. UHCC 0451]MEA5576047.1 hypothetical protein [Anabaena sp. UHCC 0451]